MADKQKQPLQKTFREFALPAEDDVQPAKPVEYTSLKLETADIFIKKPAANDPKKSIIPPRKNQGERWTPEFIEQQEQLENTARRYLPKSIEISRAIAESSDLDLIRIAAAGVLEQHFRGKADDGLVDSYTAAALLVDAVNYEFIADSFNSTTQAIVEEIRMAEDTKNPKERRDNIGSMEKDSRTVYVALQVAELETIKQEMKSGATAPPLPEHEQMSHLLAAAGDGVQYALLRRAMGLYNEISEMAGYLPSLRFTNALVLEASPYPDVKANKPPKGPAKTPPLRPHTP